MPPRIGRTLALPPNIVAMSAAVFLMAAGENLWKRFVPKYLEALGAPVTAIGLFGSCQDLLDGVYQYPGGWIGDRYGRRWALLLFVALAAVGYGLYWAAPRSEERRVGKECRCRWARDEIEERCRHLRS